MASSSTTHISPLAQSIVNSIPSEQRLEMVNDFWLVLRLIPKPSMDLLKRMFSSQGFQQVLYEYKRDWVINFLSILSPYLVLFFNLVQFFR